MYTLFLRNNTPRILYDFEVVGAHEASNRKNDQPKPIEKWANVYEDFFRKG